MARNGVAATLAAAGATTDRLPAFSRRPRPYLPARLPRPPPLLPVATPRTRPRLTLVLPKTPRPRLRRPPLRRTPPLPRAGDSARNRCLRRYRRADAGRHRRRAVRGEPAAAPARRRRVAPCGLFLGRGSAAVRGQRQHPTGVFAHFAGEIHRFFRL